MGAVAEHLGAWRTVRLIAAARWRSVRSSAARAWMWVGLVLGAAGLSAAAQAGDLIRLVAEIDGHDTPLGVVANTYVRQWASTGYGGLAGAVVLFVVASAVVSPLMATSPPNLLADHELVGVRTARMHPFASAVVVHAMSLVTFVQLLAVTALAGLATVDGHGRTRAMLLAWAVWVALLGVSSAALWGSRVLRTIHPRRWVPQAVLIAAAAVVSVWQLGPGATVQAGADALVWWLLEAPLVVSVVTAAVSAVVAFTCGWAWARTALTRRAAQRGVRAPSRPVRVVPRSPWVALVWAVSVSMLRTRSVAAPLATVTVLGGAAVVLVGGADPVVWSVGIGVPVCVGLAWAANPGALTGPANPWLASLPHQSRRLLSVWVTLGAAVSVTLVALSWLPALVFGRAELGATGAVLATGVAATAGVQAMCAWTAVYRPAPARTDLGDGVLTSSAAITAMLRLIAVPGAAAWVATSGQAGWRGVAGAPVSAQVAGAALVVLAAAVVVAVLLWRWQDPRVRSRALARAA